MANENDQHGATNWALLGEIQAEGLRAAGALVERLVHLVDGSFVTPDAGSDDSSSTSAGPGAEYAGAILPWFELWRDFIERTSDTFQQFSTSGVQVGIDRSHTPAHPLVIALERDGRGQGEMWLHNGTAVDQGALAPQCGALSDPDGNVLECDVDFDPPKIDGLPSRSSRGFVISISAESSPAPGCYRGIVQVRGAESVWMPLEVVVSAQSP
jgi:hypothetical protein